MTTQGMSSSTFVSEDDSLAGSGEASGAAARLNGSSRLTSFLNRLVEAPPTARFAMALGELAAAMDHAAAGRPLAVAISAMGPNQMAAETALGLTTLWARWGRSTCLIDLGTGSGSVGGAVVSTRPDLAALANGEAGSGLPSVSRLHPKLAKAGVIAPGTADVLGLISTGRLAAIVEGLKQRYDRVVLAAPTLDRNFPLLALDPVYDRVVLSLKRGKSRGGPVRELAEQAMAQGLRPIDVIWFD